MKKNTLTIYPNVFALPVSIRLIVFSRCKTKADDFPECVIYGSYQYMFWTADLPVERSLFFA